MIIARKLKKARKKTIANLNCYPRKKSSLFVSLDSVMILDREGVLKNTEP
jgi:hypothetical protein